MRHGKEYTHWWNQKRNDWIGRQLTGSPNVISECGYTYVHVRVEDVNLDNMRMEFLKNIGGQNHVHCQKHKLPLIRSNEKNENVNVDERSTTDVVIFTVKSIYAEAVLPAITVTRLPVLQNWKKVFKKLIIMMNQVPSRC